MSSLDMNELSAIGKSQDPCPGCGGHVWEMIGVGYSEPDELTGDYTTEFYDTYPEDVYPLIDQDAASFENSETYGKDLDALDICMSCGLAILGRQ